MKFTFTIIISILAVLLIGGCNDQAVADSESDTLQPSHSQSSGWEAPTDRAPTFLFIHHSTGSGFMFDGGMEGKLKIAGFEVHNRTYGDGCVGDHTDPPDWPVTFTEHYDDMIHWELPEGQSYDIVAFKSCYPASNINSEEKLADYYGYYETVKSVAVAHPETLFIPFTTPPLVPGATNPEAAERARIFANLSIRRSTAVTSKPPR